MKVSRIILVVKFSHNRLMCFAYASLALLAATPTLAQDGIVIRAGEGEQLFNGIYMMLSPEVGTNGSIMAEQTFPPGGETIVHAHDQGDELFYVVSGRGRARLGDRYEVIGPGDAILVPPGDAHQISNPFEDDLKVIFFNALQSDKVAPLSVTSGGRLPQ